MVVKGSLRIRIGDREEVLREGDSVFFKSSTPHGMIAVDGEDCVFLAMIMASDATDQPMLVGDSSRVSYEKPLMCEHFVKAVEDENGVLVDVKYNDEDKYNFALVKQKDLFKVYSLRRLNINVV